MQKNTISKPITGKEAGATIDPNNRYNMEQTVKTSNKQHKEHNEVQWTSVVPSAITTSMGGAVLGGSIGNVPGAIIGGVVGTAIAIWSEYHQPKKRRSNNSQH